MQIGLGEQSVTPYRQKLLRKKDRIKTTMGITLSIIFLNQFECYEYLQTNFQLIFNNYEKDVTLRTSRLASLFITTILSLHLAKKFSPKFLFFFSSLILAGIHIFLNFCDKNNFQLFSLVFGIGSGVSMGSVAIVPYYLIWGHYNPEIKHVATGIFFYFLYISKMRILPTLLKFVWQGTIFLDVTYPEYNKPQK